MPPGMQQQIAQMQQNGGMGGMQEMMKNMMGGGGDMPDMEEMQRKPTVDPPKVSRSVPFSRDDGTNGWYGRHGRHGEYACEDDGCNGQSINRSPNTTLFIYAGRSSFTICNLLPLRSSSGKSSELGKVYNYIIYRYTLLMRR